MSEDSKERKDVREAEADVVTMLSCRVEMHSHPPQLKHPIFAPTFVLFWILSNLF